MHEPSPTESTAASEGEAVWSAGWAAAEAAALESLAQEGVPVGAALIDASGVVVASAHNRHHQHHDVTAHAEIECLRAVGELPLSELAGLTMVSTSVPCMMCSGALVHLGVRRVIAGVAVLPGAEPLPSHRFLASHGVEVVDLGRLETTEWFASYMVVHPDDWQEDFGTALDGADIDVDATLAELRDV